MKPFLLFIVFALTLSFSSRAQYKNYLDQPYMESRVSVDTLVTPDKIYLSILITEKDTKGKFSAEELENKMAKELKSIGINIKKQLKLNDLSSNFKKYFLKKQDVLKSKNYSLEVYDAKTAGTVIVALEQIGIANVNLEKTEYSKMEALELILKKKALIKAQNEAKVMLNAVGQKLGPVIHLTDISNQRFKSLQGRVAGIQVLDAAPRPESYKPIAIEFDKIKVDIELYVKFQIN